MRESTVAYIYAVTEQDSSDIIYVGLTRNPDLSKRLFYHFNEPRSALYKKKKLSIRLIESVDFGDGFRTERKWIEFYLDNGANLLNRKLNPNRQI